MFSHWAYILIGNDRTGKTSFQKHLIYELCGSRKYKKLDSNLVFDITNPRMPRGVAKLSAMNRSYQERLNDYGDASKFFSAHFKDADICILSSHVTAPAQKNLRDMINELRVRAYNVAAVFFSNGYNDEAKQISLLDWDERLRIKNPPCETDEEIQAQLTRLATEFSHMLIARAIHL